MGVEGVDSVEGVGSVGSRWTSAPRKTTASSWGTWVGVGSVDKCGGCERFPCRPPLHPYPFTLASPQATRLRSPAPTACEPHSPYRLLLYCPFPAHLSGNEVTDDGLAKAFNKYTSFAKAKVRSRVFIWVIRSG